MSSRWRPWVRRKYGKPRERYAPMPRRAWMEVSSRVTRSWRAPAILSSGNVFDEETIGETSGCPVLGGNWDSSWALTLGRRINTRTLSRQHRRVGGVLLMRMLENAPTERPRTVSLLPIIDTKGRAPKRAKKSYNESEAKTRRVLRLSPH